ncbi:hypothetical protein DER46DRAFT_502303 [Fusarium sp. MPI-SDFR-AT-0072]|nr:hypothetical protein DER46DRAFT_502303 [Fusarium sp. MPI-SDFR-AT-0072]
MRLSTSRLPWREDQPTIGSCSPPTSVFFFRNIWYIPFMFFPLYPWLSGPMDELYPTTANLNDITFHCALFVVQFAFLISPPFLIYLPVSLYFLSIATVLGLNVLMCRHFNKGIPDDGLKSTQDEFSRGWRSHDDEYWIFLSGICVGRNWLQHNIDRLSRTFHRPIVGVHNTTYGVIFDLVQCLIQRAFLYTTSDARQYYMLVEKALYRRGTKKIVLILHSQGGIKGSMVLDYLLEEVPRDLLQSLEVYTFGCLANHFSNPYRRPAPSATTAEVLEQGDVASEDIHRRTIPHIEHYANVYDFASRWGVLSFTRAKRGDPFENRFMGRVFVNPRAGHQLNQHYLDSIFPLDRTMRFTPVPKEGDFMGMDAFVNTGHSWIKSEKKVLRVATQIDSAVITIGSGIHSGLKMWELSRLWQYRNGRVPADTSTIGKV